MKKAAKTAKTTTAAHRLVGVIHLPPLPGSPRCEAPLAKIAEVAAREASMLAAHGYDAVVVENFGDTPFFAGRVPAITVASMAAVGAGIARAGVDVCVNVLRNDGESALAIAVAIGAVAIRVNVLTGARVTDQGVIEGNAAALFRERRVLAPLSARGRIDVWADVDVKHSASLGAPRDLAVETADLVKRALADAVLVTGEATGASVVLARLAAVREASDGKPVLVASGATIATLPALAKHAHGVIVGSALRAAGKAGAPLEEKRVRDFARAFRDAFG